MLAKVATGKREGHLQGEPHLEFGKEGCEGELPVMLPQLLLAGLHVAKELPAADGTGDTGPGGPEVLHPAQSAAVEQDAGLGELCGATEQAGIKAELSPVILGICRKCYKSIPLSQ